MLECGSNSAPLWWPTTVMWQRRDVFNGPNGDPRTLKTGNRTLASRARAFHANFNFLHTKLRRSLGTRFRSTLRGERSTLAAPLEPRRPGRRPAKDIAVQVGNRYGRVIESRLNVRDGTRHITPNFFSFRACQASRSPRCRNRSDCSRQFDNL